jgi:ribose transport system ATP-binding protein
MPDVTDRSAVLEARGVRKRFGTVVALKDANLVLRKGEIVALMGANGAGKSTLVKILTGALGRDGGSIRINGRQASFGSPGAAQRAGLVPVYQEPSLIPHLDVTDNLRLRATPADAFRHWVNALGVTDLRMDDPVGGLPLAALRILDLARALAVEPDVLMLDEMTAALPTDLVERVLRVFREQADAGRSIIYISHRFAEIAQVCDRATVLRDGATVGDLNVTPGVEETIVGLMLGTDPAATQRRPLGQGVRVAAGGAPRLQVSNLAVGSKLSDVSFALHAGEVLGVVGLEGQGQDELFEALAGIRHPSAGTIAVDGQVRSFGHPADAIAAGLSFVPGNRADALLPVRSVRENIALPLIARARAWGPIAMRAEAARVGTAIARLQIDTRAQGEVRRLSGGNQQKVTIGRWIASGVRTLLLFDPTRGIDVRTKRQIYALVRELAEQGAAILFYTSELNEIQAACDRSIVVFGGRVVDEIAAADADEAHLMRAAYGLTARGGSARPGGDPAGSPMQGAASGRTPA